MKRLKNWPSRFAALEASARLYEYAWGVHDCCLWAADAVEACTGMDPAAAWRGTYTDVAGAAVVMRRLGGLRRVGAMAGSAIDPRFAIPGDVGLLVMAGSRPRLAVCSGFGWLSLVDRGLTASPVDSARYAWGVGRV